MLHDSITPRPWPEFTTEFLALYAEPLRARSTCVGMAHVLALVAQLGVESTADLTPATVARLVASRTPAESPNTTHGHLAYLRAACTYAAAMGYLHVSPFVIRSRWIRKVAPQHTFHSREQVAQVLDRARTEAATGRGWSRWRKHRLYALTSIVAYTGLRKMEASRLRIEDVDLPGRMLNILPRVGNRLKTEASAAPVPVCEPLAAILAEWLPCLELPASRGTVRGPRPRNNPDSAMDPGWLIPNCYRSGPWIGGSAGHRPVEQLGALGLRAGVEGLTFLSLRHSWATAAEGLGLSEEQIKRVLRHTSIRTQAHYSHADAQNLRDSVRGFGFGAGGESTE